MKTYSDPLSFSLFSSRAVLTPCVGICELDTQGLCKGCHRTGDEIARWSQLSDAERLQLMMYELPEREAKRA